MTKNIIILTFLFLNLLSLNAQTVEQTRNLMEKNKISKISNYILYNREGSIQQNPELENIYEFDMQKNMILKSSYYNNNILQKEIYIFNKDNSLNSEMWLNTYGDTILFHKNIYQKNNKSQIIEKRTVIYDSIDLSKVYYTYNEKDLLIQEIFESFGDEGFTSTAKYDYDSGKQLISKIVYDSDGKIESSQYYEYEKSLLIRIVFNQGEEDETFINFQYDEKGNLKLSDGSVIDNEDDSSSKFKEEYEYDNKNLRIKEVSYDNDAVQYQRTTEYEFF
jgi:hypothetical protein